MGKVDIKWKTDVPQKAKDIVQRVVEGLWLACEVGADIIGNESAKQVPFEKGTLQKSWEVKPLPNQIGFGFGYHTPYAARLHEHPEYKFKNGRKAKYLEQPIEQNMGDYKGQMLAKLKEVTAK